MAITGFTADTAKHLQLDAGAFFKGYNPATDSPSSAAAKLLGATAGGGSFSAVPTIRRIEIDGVKGAVKGLETIDEWEVTMTANVKEITANLLKSALAAGKSASSTTPAGTKITAGNDIVDGDYIDNITWVGRISGSSNPVIIVLKNALCTNGLTLTTADKQEGVIPLTFTGHYTADALDTPPFEIYFPSIT